MYTPGRSTAEGTHNTSRNHVGNHLIPYDIPNLVLPSGFFFSERVSQAATKPRGHKLGIQVGSIEFEGSRFRVLGFNLWRIIVYGT